MGVGRIFHTPTLAYAGTPRRKLRLSVATFRVRDDGSDETQIHSVVLYGALCDIWHSKLLKMDTIGIVAELTYHEKRGDSSQRVTELRAQEIELITRASEQFDRDDDTPF
jgi:single-stranded DNA-binding protein